EAFRIWRRRGGWRAHRGAAAERRSDSGARASVALEMAGRAGAHLRRTRRPSAPANGKRRVAGARLRRASAARTYHRLRRTHASIVLLGLTLGVATTVRRLAGPRGAPSARLTHTP